MYLTENKASPSITGAGALGAFAYAVTMAVMGIWESFLGALGAGLALTVVGWAIGRIRTRLDPLDFYAATLTPPNHVGVRPHDGRSFPLGSQFIWVRVEPKRAVRIDYFNIRFVTKFVDMAPVDADERSVSIRHVSHQETVVSPPFRQSSDTKGGLHVYPKGGFDRGPGRPLWLMVEVHAHNPWEGYLSIKAPSDRGEISFARVYLCFV